MFSHRVHFGRHIEIVWGPRKVSKERLGLVKGVCEWHSVFLLPALWKWGGAMGVRRRRKYLSSKNQFPVKSFRALHQSWQSRWIMHGHLLRTGWPGMQLFLWWRWSGVAEIFLPPQRHKLLHEVWLAVLHAFPRAPRFHRSSEMDNLGIVAKPCRDGKIKNKYVSCILCVQSGRAQDTEIN